MTETQTTDLAAWLTQIWDEEERLAKAAFSGQWDPEEGWGEDGRAVTPHVGIIHEDVQRAHVVRWHPGAVLARIAADRKILAECLKILAVDGWEYADAPDLAEFVIRQLRSTQADRPGYPLAVERLGVEW